MDSLTDLEVKILETSAKEFEKKGFHLANVEEVADKIGIGKGTIYRHFGNKASLFMSVVRYSHDLIIKGFYKMEPFENFETAMNLFFEKAFNLSKIWGGFFFTASTPENKWLVKKEMAKSKDLKGSIVSAKASLERAIRLMSGIIEMGKREGKVAPEVDSLVSADIILMMTGQYLMAIGDKIYQDKRLGLEVLFPEERALAELRRFIFSALGCK